MKRILFLVFISFVGLFVLWLVAKPGYVYSFPGDSFVVITWLNVIKNGVGFDWSPFIGHTFQPGYLFIVWLASIFPLNFLADFQLLIFGITFLVFFSSIKYFSKLLGTVYPAVFSGLMITTSIYYQWHFAQNIDLASIFLLPGCFYYLFRFLKEPSNTNVLILSVFISLQLAISLQIGYLFLILFTFLVLSQIGYSVLVRRSFSLRSTVYLIVLLGMFTMPITLNLLRVYLLAPGLEKNAFSLSLRRNNLLDLIAFSARPWDYLTPSIYHPVFGSSVRNFYQHVKENYSYQFWSTFLPERANYLTFTGMGLATYAVWTAFRSWRRKTLTVSLDDSRNISLFMLLAIFMFLVSMPAVIEIKGFHFYFPSYFLFKIFPMFRVYTRAGVFVLLAVAVLAGYGLKFLLSRIGNDRSEIKFGGISLPARKSVVLTTVLCGFVLFENLSFPPFPVMDVGRVPQVYAWLKSQPGDLVIAEYPRDNSVVDIGGGCPSWLDPKITRDYNVAYVAFYQTVHGKKTFGAGSLSKDERVGLGYLDSVSSYQILKKNGVNYVLVHTKDPLIGIHPWPYPQENPLDECWQRRIMKKPEKVYDGFKKVAEFEDGVIYSLELGVDRR